MTMFAIEKEFEDSFVELLTKYGWSDQIIEYPNEEVLIQNWANILFDNNRGIDRLGDYPLTRGEMNQILEQIYSLRTPLKLNGFINGRNVIIRRDNPDDREHFGKEVSLKIYDRNEIAAGQSRYQIVRQPKFSTRSKLLSLRRGDVLLLINGMPVIHIELKRSGIPVSQASNQIQKYAAEGVYSGIFALVQIMVAATPEETLYFANPGPDGRFNASYLFHWADFNNDPINEWQRIVSTLLSIPMAHQLIGFYTVADNGEGVLKVMRSYQYYAASQIADKVAKCDWTEENQLGGFVWHTTGSGKTLTSFKSAQLIAAMNKCDKVIFLVDRIELGTQSLKEYRGFADESEDVNDTRSTLDLANKILSDNPNEILIVTSIQKMSGINLQEAALKTDTINKMQGKRIVFIVDECHRSTFGDMLITIKQTFKNSLFFGFTGTPIHEENQKMLNTTATIFGSELHRYSIADGIRDKNVLGFDTYKVLTYKDGDLKKQVALYMAKAKNLTEVYADKDKTKIYEKYYNLPMAGHKDQVTGKYVKGIEDYVPSSQYEVEEHQKAVVKDIKENWQQLSRNNKFHSILATSSIPEAIVYYRLFKKHAPELNITALFDPNIDNDNSELAINKEQGLIEIIADYNQHYGQRYAIPTYGVMKKDIALRLAHKGQYKSIKKDKQIDLLIVVDQMLTGYDSKWVNTLYLDKVLKYENLIQAFSRTNRLFGEEKPFGIIKYYRYPHTMQCNIEDAVKLYSGDKPFSMFVNKLKQNLEIINMLNEQIELIFVHAGIPDLSKLPDDTPAVCKFVKLFNDLNLYLEAAKIQGFSWNKTNYTFELDNQNKSLTVHCNLLESTYLKYLLRYKEIYPGGEYVGLGSGDSEPPFDVKPYITTIDTGKIDYNYMNSRFSKYKKALETNDPEAVKIAYQELHDTFATLNKDEQEAAGIIIHDIERGNFFYEEDKNFRDYITEYLCKKQNDRIRQISEVLGVSKDQLTGILSERPNESKLNEYGRFSALADSADRVKAKSYFDNMLSTKLHPRKIPIYVDKVLREFILSEGKEDLSALMQRLFLNKSNNGII